MIYATALVSEVNPSSDHTLPISIILPNIIKAVYSDGGEIGGSGRGEVGVVILMIPSQDG